MSHWTNKDFKFKNICWFSKNNISVELQELTKIHSIYQNFIFNIFADYVLI